MPDKLTDSEITIKALKELLEVVLSEGDLQRTSTISHTIDLINRLKEDLAKKDKELLEELKYSAVYKTKVIDSEKEINRLQAENKRLKDILDKKVIEFADDKKQKIKAEAYKEFAERLKTEYAQGINWFGKKEHYFVNVEDIDNLLKEMVGEDK